jgi:hypothetical protein
LPLHAPTSPPPPRNGRPSGQADVEDEEREAERDERPGSHVVVIDIG